MFSSAFILLHIQYIQYQHIHKVYCYNVLGFLSFYSQICTDSCPVVLPLPPLTHIILTIVCLLRETGFPNIDFIKSSDWQYSVSYTHSDTRALCSVNTSTEQVHQCVRETSVRGGGETQIALRGASISVQTYAQ